MVAEGTKIELKNIVLVDKNGGEVEMEATLCFDEQDDVKDIAKETKSFLKELNGGLDMERKNEDHLVTLADLEGE